MTFVTWRRTVVIGLLAVSGLGGLGVWALCRAAAADTLIIRNELDESPTVRALPTDLCPDKVIKPGSSVTYDGGPLCQHPVEIYLRSDNLDSRCSWRSAKEREPVIVTGNSVNCSPDDALQIENLLDEPITVKVSSKGSLPCPNLTVEAGSSATYGGGISCLHPYRVSFLATGYHVRCDWSDAKTREPVIVTSKGVSCSEATPAPP